MNSREQTLASVLVGLIVLAAGTALGYFFLYQPYRAAQSAEVAANTEIAELTRKAGELRKNAQALATARTRSLPADEALARREYTVALGRMIAASGVKDYSVSQKQVDNTARSVPQLAKDKPLYTRVAYELVLKKIDIWALDDFLKAYYEFGLLHQITALTIKKEDEPGAKVQRRNDLTVTITTEALIVDGADNRRTLLPVPTGVAAVGGGLLQKAVGTRPEVARAFRTTGAPPEYNPDRDSGLMVLKDPFNGPLPPPPPFKIAKLDDLKLQPDEKPKPVKVALSGDGSTGATVTAKLDGKLYPADARVKVDPKTNSIELPTPKMTEENVKATATVTVTAKSSEGKTSETSFKISMVEPPKDEDPPPPAPKATEDISKVILLIAVVQGSDGTAWARVVDNANRTRYEVNVTKGEIAIKKEWVVGGGRWKEDTHKAPPGAMHISDEFSATDRLLKVVAIDGNSLIVADLQPGGPPKAPPPAKAPAKRPGFGPPPTVKQGPGSPQAAIGGNVVVAVPAPKYYRWVAGQSLAALKPLSDQEKAEVLERVANGSVLVSINP